MFRDGTWQLLDCQPAWSGNDSYQHFLVFAWHDPDGKRVIVQVNLSEHPSQCHVRLPYAELEGRLWQLRDELRGVRYGWRGDDLRGRGLFLDAPPWQVAIDSLWQRI
ncbi:MAG: hypothetical protein FJ295_11175 [Planctomycetes bacterium]|nr:hypothetical protein [Planctomycetota bacterium]